MLSSSSRQANAAGELLLTKKVSRTVARNRSKEAAAQPEAALQPNRSLVNRDLLGCNAAPVGKISKSSFARASRSFLLPPSGSSFLSRLRHETFLPRSVATSFGGGVGQKIVAVPFGQVRHQLDKNFRSPQHANVLLGQMFFVPPSHLHTTLRQIRAFSGLAGFLGIRVRKRRFYDPEGAAFGTCCDAPLGQIPDPEAWPRPRRRSRRKSSTKNDAGDINDVDGAPASSGKKDEKGDSPKMRVRPVNGPRNLHAVRTMMMKTRGNMLVANFATYGTWPGSEIKLLLDWISLGEEHSGEDTSDQEEDREVGMLG